MMAGCATRPAAWLEKGKKAADAGKYAEAEIDDLKATQAKPDYGEAWYALGLAQFKQGHLGDAIATFERATQLLPSRQDVAISMAEVSMAAYLASPNRPAELYQRLATTSNDLLRRDPNSYDGLRLKGFVAMIDRHYSEALGLLRKADSIKPGQGDVTQALMQCLIQNEQGAEAEKLGTAFLANHKDFIPVYDLLYSYYMTNHREGEGEKLLQSKVAANPGQLVFRLQLARHYLDAHNDAAVAEVVKQVLADSKNFPDAGLEVGDFYNLNNRHDDALRVFQAGAAKEGKQKSVWQLRVANTLVAAGKPEQAVPVLNEVLKGDAQNADARSLLATIRLGDGNADDFQAAFSELSQLVKERPKDATIQYTLGRAYLRKGNTDAALNSFQEALRLNPQLVQARALAADASMRRGDFTGAARLSDDLVAQTNGNPAARLLRAEALTGLGNFGEANRVVDELSREFPNAVEPRLQLAALRLAQKRYSEAEEIYRALYQANRKDLRALRGLVNTMSAEQHYDAAIQLLNQEKAAPGAPVAQLDALLADAALRGRKLDIAVQQYSRLVTDTPNSAFDHLRLGDAYLQKGNTQQAVSEFQTAQKLNPKDAETNVMLAQSLNQAGKTTDAERSYREALALQPDNPFVKNNLAYLLAEKGGNLDDALRLAQEASRQRPDVIPLADTLAYIYIKKNLPDSAIQILSNLTRKNAGQPVYHYHLALALLQRGDKSGARREGEAALASNPVKADEEKIRGLLAGVR
jgi:tetratricopeptide (TPR) repeat protein